MQTHQFFRRLIPRRNRFRRAKRRDAEKQHRKREEEGRYRPVNSGSFLHGVSSFLSVFLGILIRAGSKRDEGRRGSRK